MNRKHSSDLHIPVLVITESSTMNTRSRYLQSTAAYRQEQPVTANVSGRSTFYVRGGPLAGRPLDEGVSRKRRSAATLRVMARFAWPTTRTFVDRPRIR